MLPIIKRTYVGIISLALASAITSLSVHIKILTLPAFTMLGFLGFNQYNPLYHMRINYTYELYTNVI